MTDIRIFGVNDAGESTCVRVKDFTPYVYIELPTNVHWDQFKIKLFCEKMSEVLRENRPIEMKFFRKKKLYYVHRDSSNNDVLFPFMFCTFSSTRDRLSLLRALQKQVRIFGIGTCYYKVHESNASPILQLTCCRNLPSAGWITFSKAATIRGEERVTSCVHEYEVSWKRLKPAIENIDLVGKVKVMSFDIEVNSSTVPSTFPKASRQFDCIFQISCVFKFEGVTTSYLLTLGDPYGIRGDGGVEVVVQRFLSETELMIGFSRLVCEENPNVIIGYNILGFDIQYMIDRAKNPNGAGCFPEFSKLGFTLDQQSEERVVKWYSSARGHQEYRYLDIEGRLIIDLFPIVQRDYKLDNYQLKTVTKHILKDTKDDLSPDGIFQCYRVGSKYEIVESEGGGRRRVYSPEARKAMAVCGKYCVKDSALVLNLYDKMQIFIGLVEMANIFNVTPFDMYTKGQQVKVFSQVYKFAMYNNIVVEKDGYVGAENERYAGAHVFEPKPGLYNCVVPFDFSSLYPSIMIAYNIDYSTLVLDGAHDGVIPDRDCHVVDFEDHIWCEHDPKFIRRKELTLFLEKEKKEITRLRAETKSKKLSPSERVRAKEELERRLKEIKVYEEERRGLKVSKNVMCGKRHYRFLKEPRGVIPTILQNSLDARKRTRAQIKSNLERIKSGELDPAAERELLMLNSILDKRQLSYKVSSNSMYGAMGVTKGYLPFMPGAMCITYLGRMNIEKVARTIPEKYGGRLIYGDTDSNYVVFPKLTTAEEIWDHAVMVAREISAVCPKPMALEFEQTIYWTFFIISKKRYMYTECKRDGVVSSKIGKKGVLLARRDNSVFIKRAYEKIVGMIFEKSGAESVLAYVLEEINRLCYRGYCARDFVITKSVGDSGNYKDPESFECVQDKNGKAKYKIGSYTVKKLLEESKDSDLKKKNARTDAEFYLKSLPAQAQLAEKMRRRGKRVDSGARLEFVITKNGGHTAAQSEKIEDIDYFEKFGEILTVDYLSYLKLLINPVDQILNIAFGGAVMEGGRRFPRDFCKGQYKLRLAREEVMKELKKIVEMRIEFE